MQFGLEQRRHLNFRSFRNLGNLRAPEMTNVKVGILSASDDAPVLLAIKQGFFKQQGLNVSYTIMPSTNSSTALLQSHTIQFAIMNYVGMFQQEKAFPGLNLRIIADNVQTSPGLFDFMVAKDSKIKTLADLKGKKLSVPSAGVFSFPQLSLDVLGKPYGVNAASVTDVAIPFPAAPQALASGKVDAAFTTEPFITIMEQTDRGEGPCRHAERAAGRLPGVRLGDHRSTTRSTIRRPWPRSPVRSRKPPATPRPTRRRFARCCPTTSRA